MAYLYDKSHAEDLYQEILLHIWQSLDRYKGEALMSTWIYRIAVNTAIGYNARNKKNKHEELPARVTMQDDHPDTDSDEENRLIKLRYCISQLEEQDRLVISLVLEGLSYKEIADITGSNVNNTGVRISRIKARLLKLMDPKTARDEF